MVMESSSTLNCSAMSDFSFSKIILAAPSYVRCTFSFNTICRIRGTVNRVSGFLSPVFRVIGGAILVIPDFGEKHYA